MSGSPRPRGRAGVIAWTILVAALLLSVALVLTPMGILMPFKAQTPDGVRLSYHLRLWSPRLTPLLLGLGIAAAVVLWRRTRSRWIRGLACAPVALLAGCAWLARQNHFEWMFRPLHAPAYTDARGPHGVEDADLVLGVTSGGEASAYPVRALAYHHVVNDTVGGRAIVATY